MLSDQSRQQLARPFAALTVLLAALTHGAMLPAGALELSRIQPASAPCISVRFTLAQPPRANPKRNSTATFEQAFTSAFLQQNAAAKRCSCIGLVLLAWRALAESQCHCATQTA